MISVMNRRKFLATAAFGPAGALPVSLQAQNYSDYTRDPRPDVPEGTFTAGSAPGTIFWNSHCVLVSG